MKKNSSTAIVGTVGLPAAYGGFETIVEQLARRYEGDRDVIVYCSALTYPTNVQMKRFKNFILV